MFFKKKLSTNLSGGLGNCIFQYLTAKIIANQKAVVAGIVFAKYAFKLIRNSLGGRI